MVCLYLSFGIFVAHTKNKLLYYSFESDFYYKNVRLNSFGTVSKEFYAESREVVFNSIQK